MGSHVIEREMVSKCGIGSKRVRNFMPLSFAFCTTMQKRSKLSAIEITFGSLIEEIWCNNSFLYTSCLAAHFFNVFGQILIYDKLCTRLKLPKFNIYRDVSLI